MARWTSTLIVSHSLTRTNSILAKQVAKKPAKKLTEKTATLKECRACYEALDGRAIKCPSCGSDQSGFRRHINLTVPVLGLLVALASVIVTGHRQIKNLIFGAEPHLVIASLPPKDGRNLTISIINEGDASAVVAYLTCYLEETYADHRLVFTAHYSPKIESILPAGRPTEMQFFSKRSFAQFFAVDDPKQPLSIDATGLSTSGDGVSSPIWTSGCIISYRNGDKEFTSVIDNYEYHGWLWRWAAERLKEEDAEGSKKMHKLGFGDWG